MVNILYRLLVVNLLGNLLIALANLLRLPRLRARPAWVRLTVKDPLPSRPPPHGRWLLRPGVPSLAALSRLCDDLARDPRLQGVVVELRRAPPGFARLESLRTIIKRLAEAGKRVVVHLSSPSLKEYFVASAATTILVDESGPLSLVGLAAEVTFFAGALEKAGARADAEYRGEYKSFAEVFTRKEMSPQHREALEAILVRIEEAVRDAVSASRKVEPKVALEWIQGGPYTAEEAARRGLVDGVCYADEVAERLGNVRVGTPSEWRGTRVSPLRYRPLVRVPRKVRVVSLHGAIVTGEGSELRRTLGADAAIRALDKARKDRRVAAVVLHVDSRGGSAVGSDLIWRATTRLSAEKPVIAYFDDVAASGGYYLACGAHKIVAQPGTLTGSIGVVAGKLSFQGLLERLGLNVTTVRRGDAATMDSVFHGYSDEERRRLAAEVDALYAQFVKKVALGRKLAPDAAEAAAKGRVWTGIDARDKGLVDSLGDMETALTIAEDLARRRPGEKFEHEDVHVAPKRRGLVPRILGAELPPLPASLEDIQLLASEGLLLMAPYSVACK
ncbi:MAG: signal peptide peptidase SppA [Deltaproteobacteria bacterium]|nr:signal peptide peptidase SppA [Deltaproteobacteria bacterium]